jgi:hypothetical protein
VWSKRKNSATTQSNPESTTAMRIYSKFPNRQPHAMKLTIRLTAAFLLTATSAVLQAQAPARDAKASILPIRAGEPNVSRVDAALLPKANPPAKVAFGQQPIQVKVLVLEFNPTIPAAVHSPRDPSARPRKLSEVAGWRDPLALAGSYMQDVSDASGGFIQYRIVEWNVVNEFQKKTDGFTYTPESYVKCLRLWQSGSKSDPWHQPDGTDYAVSIERHKLVARVESGEIDEVWWFGAPWMGWFESSMAGQGAFYINGGVFDRVPCKRPFIIMGFSYEREVACMLEDLCHRTEATMSRVYGGWKVDQLTTTWARFAANAHQSNGVAAVGTCHYPPNGVRDYDFSNPRTVQSSADDWLNFPVLTGATKPVSRDTWGGPDYHRNYIKWWFSHLPKAPTVNADGRQNNWWKYVFDYWAYDELGKQRSGSLGPAVKPSLPKSPKRAGVSVETWGENVG